MRQENYEGYPPADKYVQRMQKERRAAGIRKVRINGAVYHVLPTGEVLNPGCVVCCRCKRQYCSGMQQSHDKWCSDYRKTRKQREEKKQWQKAKRTLKTIKRLLRDPQKLREAASQPERTSQT